MSEGNETKGRCRSELDNAFGPYTERVAIADAIDRLAADVAAIKEKVDALSPEDVAHLVESEKAWVSLVEKQRDDARDALIAALRERDEARGRVESLKESLGAANHIYGKVQAEVERLRAELAARLAANSQSSPSPDYYLVTNERDIPIHVSRMHPGVEWDGYTITALYAAPQPAANSPGISDGSPEPRGWLTEEEEARLGAIAVIVTKLGYTADAEIISAILARAGSPPVVEVPEEKPGLGHLLHRLYRDAISRAGISWKEVPRE